MKITLEIPIYCSPSYHRDRGYQYIRTSDIKDLEVRNRLEEYVKWKVRPLLWSPEEGEIKDAVLLDDYKEFVNIINEEERKLLDGSGA